MRWTLRGRNRVGAVSNFGPVLRRGDVNGGGFVDARDATLMLAARNQPASGPDDPRDLDDDGWITLRDVPLEALLLRQENE